MKSKIIHTKQWENSEKMNEQNLKPFPPGQSGNPKGRPKNLPGLNALLAETLGEDSIEVKEILKAIIAKAKKGNVIAAKLILNRAYGLESRQMDIRINNSLADVDLTRLSNESLQEVLALFENER